MAQLGTALVDTYLIGATPELIAKLPGGGLNEPYVLLAVVDTVSANFSNRFPTPPIAWGFLIDFPSIDDSPAYDRLVSKAYGDIAGALTVEGKYLEPNIGQIWPR